MFDVGFVIGGLFDLLVDCYDVMGWMVSVID